MLPEVVMPMKVSVVIAAYNGGKYLREQLESIFGQAELPDELIVSDDGSTDETLFILREFEKISPFEMKVYLRGSPSGFASNFSDACLRATGDIIVFCDQDDVWDVHKIGEIKSYFLSNPDRELVLHDFAVCDSGLRTMVDSYCAYLECEGHDPDKLVKGCATAIRRGLRDRAFPLPSGGRWTHDRRVHALAHFAGTRGKIGKVLMRYRVHSSNTSGYVLPKNNWGGAVAAFLKARGQRRSSLAGTTIQFFSFRDITDSDLDEFYSAHLKKTADSCGSEVVHRECSLSDLKVANRSLDNRTRALRLETRSQRLLECFRLAWKGDYSDAGGWYALAHDALMSLGRHRRGSVVK